MNSLMRAFSLFHRGVLEDAGDPELQPVVGRKFERTSCNRHSALVQDIPDSWREVSFSKFSIAVALCDV